MTGTNIVPRDEDKPNLMAVNAFYRRVTELLSQRQPDRRELRIFLDTQYPILIHQARLDYVDGLGRLAELKLQIVEKTMRFVLDWITKNGERLPLVAVSLGNIEQKVKDVFEKRERLARRYRMQVFPKIPEHEPLPPDLFDGKLPIVEKVQLNPERPARRARTKQRAPKPDGDSTN